MPKLNESSTDKVLDDGDGFSDFGSIKKPNWVDMAPLDGVADDSLINQLVYKPALRFHSLSGSLWSPALGRSPSIATDSRPPSYRFSESTRHKNDPDDCSSCDQGSLYNARNVALSPLTLRRRNTVAVIFVAIALLAAVAAVTGIILHFINPRAIVSANVRFTVANRNFTNDMRNDSSQDYRDIAEPICAEMDQYFLTSELSDFYFGCTFKEISEDRSKPGSAVYLTLDFVENMLTNNGERIKKIIMKKSGRHQTDDTLFLVIRDFLVYLRSLRIDLDIIPMSGDHPKKLRPSIPWNELDFIFRKSTTTNSLASLTPRVSPTVTTHISNVVPLKTVLPERRDKMLRMLTPTLYSASVTMSSVALFVSSVNQESYHVSSISTDDSGPHKLLISPTKTSETLPKTVEEGHDWITPLDQLPVIQEFVGIHGIVKALIRNNILSERKRVNHYDGKQTNVIPAGAMSVEKAPTIDRRKLLKASFLEASFYPLPEASARNNKATQTMPPTLMDVSQSFRPKVFSLHSGTVMIMGKTNKAFKSGDPTPMLDETIRKILSSDLSRMSSTIIMTSSKLDTLLDHSLSTVELPSVTTLYNLRTITQHETNTIIASKTLINEHLHSSYPVNLFGDIELKELVVDDPKQEILNPTEGTIQWTNIFNIPIRTETIEVGDLKRVEQIQNSQIMNDGNTQLSKVNNVDKIDTGVKSVQRNQNNYYETKPKTKRKQTNILDYIQSFTDLTTVNKNNHMNELVPLTSQRKHSHVHHIHTHDFILNLIDGAELNKSTLLPPKPNQQHIQSGGVKVVKLPSDTSVDSNAMRVKFRSTLPLLKIRHKFPFNKSVSPNSQINAKHKGNENDSRMRHSIIPKSNLNKGNGVLFLKNGNFDGKPALFIHTTDRENNNKITSLPQKHGPDRKQPIAKKTTTNKIPWIFLHNLNINFGNITNNWQKSRGHVPSKHYGRQGPVVMPFHTIPGSTPHWKGQAGFFDRFHSGFVKPSVYTYNKYIPRSPWTKFGHRFIPRRHIPRRHLPGLTKSSNFSDIDGMKDVMQQLVNSLANMTIKIDKMETAINFVNKTLHETQQPLFRLEDTLENMTLSLENLNGNLRDVNQTLLSIKYFLKQFDNSVFNLDDVLLHLDNTVANLGKSVRFVGSSMVDLDATITNAIGNVDYINDTLSHINRSVADVNQTATFTNKTLESMSDTLASLEIAIGNLNNKVGFVANKMDTFNFSLHGINKTIHNSFGKLSNLQKRLTKVNSTVDKIDVTVKRLNSTYTQLGQRLGNMNETFAFVNGTMLDVIQKLSDIDGNLANVVSTMYGMRDNMTGMNDSISDTMVWMKGMLDTLHKFNLTYHFNNETIRLALNNVDLIETVGLLLDLNGTLVGLGKNVDEINMNLDSMDGKMTALEESLVQFEDTLSRIGVTFEMLNKTLALMNTTMMDTRSSLSELSTTVDHMETSIEDVNPSFEVINTSLDFINKTFESVDDDQRYIKTTIKQVNNTLKTMNQTARSLDNLGKNLNVTINEIRGSIPEMGINIYNANESLRMLKGKTDIFEESYNMINRTMTKMELAFNDIVNRLVEAETTLDSTDNTFHSVNNSIAKIEDSFGKIGDQLEKLEDTFEIMDNSMNGIGSAFPTISGSVKDTKGKINSLRKRLMASKDKLEINYTKRNNSLNRYDTLKNKLFDLKNEIKMLGQNLNDIQNLSKSVNADVEELKKNVHSIDFIYNKVDENFKIINSTLPRMQDKFKNLQIATADVSTGLDVAKDKTKRIAKSLQLEIKDTESYTNIEVPFDLFQQEINTQLLTLNDSGNDLLLGNNTFEMSKYILWTETFKPVLLQNTTESLNASISAVKETMENYTDLLSDSSAAIDASAIFVQHMDDIFEKLKKSKESIDEIQDDSDSIQDKVVILEDQLKNQSQNVQTMLEVLRKKLQKLEILRETYGNVNGTYKGTDGYDNLQQMIKQTNDTLYKLQDHLDNAKGEFQNTVDKFINTENTYKGSIINLSDNSSALLNTTLMIFEETDIHLRGVNDTIGAIGDTSKRLLKMINNISSTVETMENELAYAKDKQTYISEKRPELERGFQMVTDPIEESSIAFMELRHKINTLIAEGFVINESIENLANVNISTNHTIAQLNKTNHRLIDLWKFTDELYQNLTTKQAELINYNETDFSLSEVKQAYDDFESSLDRMKRFAIEVVNSKDEIKDFLQLTETEFDELKMMIADVKRTNESFLDTGNRLHSLELDLINADSKIRNVSARLSKVKQAMEIISANYTNFTATDIDISELYVNEALNEMSNLLLNLTILLDDESIKTNQSRRTYDDTDNVLNVNVLHRDNIDETLNSIVLPQMNQVIKQTELSARAVEDIIRKIANMETVVTKVNETIHLTNKQLFIDRQKELLADAKVTDLEEEVEAINTTIHDTEKLIDEAQDVISSVKLTYQRLKERLGNTSNSELSIDHLGDKLSKFEDIIEAFEIDISNVEDILKDINGTIRTNGSRYSPDETLAEVKDRYRRAEVHLDTLNKRINDITRDILETENKTRNVGIELMTLGKHLDDLHDVNNKMSDFTSNISSMEQELKSTTDDIDNVESHLEDLGEEYQRLYLEFQHINKTVLKNAMEDFHQDMANANGNLTTLKTGMENAQKTFNRSKSSLEASRDIANTKFQNEDMLMDIILNATDLYETAVNGYDDVRRTLSDIQINRTILKTNTDILNKRLNDIEKMFQRQEKEEYAKSFDIVDMYKSLKNSFNASIETISSMEKRHNLLSKDLSVLDKSINDTDDLNISVSGIKHESSKVEESISNIQKDINDHIETYEKLEILLYADNNKLISDDETIDQMKERYHNLIQHIKYINESLLDIKDRKANELGNTLETTENTVDELQARVDQHKENSVLLDNLLQKNDFLSELIDSLAIKNESVTHEHKRNTDSFRTLIDKYSGISNDTISNLTDKINEEIGKASRDLSTIQSIISTANTTYMEANDLLESYTEKEGSSISDVSTLDEILSLFTTVKDIVPELMKSSSELVTPLHMDVNDLNETLKHTEDDIETLDRLFRSKEKEDYFDNNFPGDRYASTSSKLTNMSYLNENIKDNNIRVDNAISQLAEKLNQHRNIEIDLQDRKDTIIGIRQQLSNNSGVLDHLSKQNLEFEQLLYAKDGQLISDSEPIEDMKTRYDEINMFLNNTNETIHAMETNLLQKVSPDLENITEEINSIDQTLDQYKNVVTTIELFKDVKETQRSKTVKIQDGINPYKELLLSSVETFKTMTEDHENVHNDVINTTMADVLEMIEDLQAFIGSHESNVSETQNMVTDVIYTLNSFEDKLLSNFTDKIELDAIINMNETISDTLNAGMADINRNIRIASNDDSSIGERIPMLLESIKRLENEFNLERKRIFLKASSPVIAEKIERIKNLLTDIDRRSELIQRKLSNVTAKGDEVLDLLPSEETVKINIDEELQNITNIKNQLNMYDRIKEKLRQELSSLNTEIITDHAQFLDPNYTSNELNTMVSTLNYTTERLSRETHLLNENLTITNETLHDHQLYFDEIISEIDDFKAVKEETLQRLASIRPIVNTNGTLSNTLEDLHEDMQNLIKSNEEMIKKFSNVNSPMLIREMEQLTNEIDETFNLNEHTHSSFKENVPNILFLQKMGETAQEQVSNVSNGLDSLKERTRKLITLNNDTKKPIDESKKKTDYIEAESTVVRDKLAKLRSTKDNLEKKLLKQQIRDYIETNFPSILEIYKKVNDSLVKVADKMSITSDNVRDVYFNLTETQSILDSIPTISIPIDDLSERYQNQAKQLNVVSGQNTKSVESFSDLEAILMASTESNETLGRIKLRFSHFNDSLAVLVDETLATETSLADIDRSAKETDESLKSLKESISNFRKVDSMVQAISENITNVGTSVGRLKKDVHSAGNDILNLINMAGEIESRFQNVNSSSLDEATLDMMDRITRLKTQYDDIKDHFDNTEVLFNQSNMSTENTKSLIGTEINDEKQLVKVTNQADEMLTVISRNASKIHLDVDVLNNIMETFKEDLQGIYFKHDNIRDSYLEKEKEDFMNETTQVLNSKIEDTDSLFTNIIDRIKKAKEDVKQGNNVLSDIHGSMSEHPQIRFTMDELQSDMELTDLKLETLNDSVFENKDLFETHKQLVIELSEDWRNSSLSQLENMTQLIEQKLLSHDETFKLFNMSMGNIENEIKSENSRRNDARTLIDRYILVKTVSLPSIESMLAQANSSIKASTDFIDSVIDEHKIQRNRLVDLNQNYNGATNGAIETLKKELEDIIEHTLNTTLSTLQQNMTENVLKEFGDMLDINRKMSDLWNNGFDSKLKLDHGLETTERDLQILYDYKHKIHDEEQRLFNLTETVNDTLSSTEKKLQEFEVLLLEQRKRDIIEDRFPKLLQRYNVLTNQFDHGIKTKESTLNDLSSVKGTEKTVHGRLNSIDNIVIPVDGLQDDIEEAARNMNILSTDIDEQYHEHTSLGILNIEPENVILNNSISVEDVLRLTDSLDKSISETEMNIDAIQKKNSEIATGIEAVDEQLTHINESINSYEDIERRVLRLGNDISDTKHNSSSLHMEILGLQDVATNLKTKLTRLQRQYRSYNYDSSISEKKLENINEILNNLLKDVRDVDSQLDINKSEKDAMLIKLYENESNETALLNTIADVTKNHNTTSTNFENANSTLTSLWNALPEVDILISDINHEMKLMNQTLINEYNKDMISNNTVPLLEKRYEETKFTFDMTNKSLEIMADSIEQLKQYISDLKQRMKDDFTNINISMTANENEIGKLEETLSNMVHHYTNMIDTVNELENRIEEHRIQGKNVSVQDVKNQYDVFNKTLNEIDEVLDKIKQDTYEMDEHFIRINSSLLDVDKSLDVFEERENKTKMMANGLSVLKDKLDQSDSFVANMDTKLDNLNNTYTHMMDFYIDVIDTTSDNNSLAEKRMQQLKAQIGSLQRSMATLQNDRQSMKEDFDRMNNTLFQQIDTQADLNNTLDTVLRSYYGLEDTIRVLKQELVDADALKENAGSSLADLSTFLADLNETLFKEKEKFDFINSNVNGLEAKFNKISGPLTATKKELSGAAQVVGDVSNKLDDVSKRLRAFPNISITFADDKEHISKMKSHLGNMTGHYEQLTNQFKDIGESISNFGVKTGELGEIRDQYDELDSTIDTMLNNISSLREDVTGIETDVSSIDRKSQRIADSLYLFGQLTDTSDNISTGVDTLDSKLDNTNVMLNEVTDITGGLENDISNMNTEYADIQNEPLKRNLSAILNELRREKEKLNSLQERKRNITTDFIDTKALIQHTKSDLHGPISDIETLENVIGNASNTLEKTDISMKGLTLQNSELLTDTESVLTNIKRLEADLKSVNESLYEEKMKAEFIRDNYPDMETRYLLLNDDLVKSNDNLNNANENAITISSELESLKESLASIHNIQIPLNNETSAVADVHQDISNMIDSYNELSNKLTSLNVFDLKTVEDTSFVQLKSDYDEFDSIMNDIKGNISAINERLQTMEGISGDVNATIIDISKTLAAYEDATKDLQNKINTNINLNSTTHRLNSTVLDMKNNLNDIQNKFKSLSNFSHIADPIILETKANIDMLLNETLGKIINAHGSVKNLDNKGNETKVDIDELQRTLDSTKNYLTQLKKHVVAANVTSGNVSKQFEEIHQDQVATDREIEQIRPEIDFLLSKVNELSDSYHREQKKIDFIADNKPLLLQKFESLDLPLSRTNEKISKSETNLADLLFDTKSVDSRLEKFRTLEITAKPELETWNNLNKTVKDMSKDFIDVSKLYGKVKDQINLLDNKDMTQAELEQQYSQINASLQAISDKIANIGNITTDVDTSIIDTRQSVNDLNKLMDTFKIVQADAKLTQQSINESESALDSLQHKADKTNSLLVKLPKTVETIESTYKLINNVKWNKLLPVVKNNISDYIASMEITNNQNLKSTNDAVQNLNTAFNGTITGLKERTLNRHNAEEQLKKWRNEVETAKIGINVSRKDIGKVKSDLGKVTKKANDINNLLMNTNDTLFIELQKQTFVNQTLPDLRDKHKAVNLTFIQNNPDMDTLTAKIRHVFGIIDKIRRKMEHFGLEDTDNSVTIWEQSMQKLNDTVTTIINDNAKANATLNSLRGKLWSEHPMYTEEETFQAVKDRIVQYNRTLDKIRANTHQINLKLNDLGDTVQNVANEATEMDVMMTTTPATTTPSGPPDWLTFTSSEGGVIGRHSAFTKCSVSDKEGWSTMTITHVNKEGDESIVAGWQLGKGARGRRSRRIKVYKKEDPMGGSLHVNISSLQCADEGTYYCAINTYSMWPLNTAISVSTPPEDNLHVEFPTEVFSEKQANFSCTGNPGYPKGKITWKVMMPNEKEFKPFDFYTAKSTVWDSDCIRTETSTVDYMFNMSWNNSKIRCYIENTDNFAQGIVRLLPFDICNRKGLNQAMSHPYTPHKYIICGQELNIMSCPGKTCFDEKEGFCIQCKAGAGGDPCIGKPMYTAVAHEHDCKKYYLCLGNTRKTKKCPNGYFTPSTTSHCVLSYAQSFCALKDSG